MTDLRGLERLIDNLERGIELKDAYVQSIAYPKQLIITLKELHNLIGNKTIKESIANQVAYLIARRDVGEKVMLNTVIYGSPGVGKTKIGLILAKIWHNLGYLKGAKSKVRPRDTSRQPTFDIEGLKVNNGMMDLAGMVVFYIIIIIFFLYSKIGLLPTIGLTIVAGIIMYWVWYKYMAPKGAGSGREAAIPGAPASEENTDELIRIVGRNDFIGKYVGWTDKKTRALLESSVGKVLFIDEAYDLCTSERDSFGMEALTTINRFMSERPGEVIIIFAGYKRQMQRTIFAAQPGLARRCIWHFSATPYNSVELCSIFEQQLQKNNYNIENKEKMLALFQREHKAFPNQGGDTERAVFFAGIERSKDILDGKAKADDNTVTVEQVRRAIEVLKKNNIEKDVDNEEEDLPPNNMDRLRSLLSGVM